MTLCRDDYFFFGITAYEETVLAMSICQVKQLMYCAVGIWLKSVDLACKLTEGRGMRDAQKGN